MVKKNNFNKAEYDKQYAKENYKSINLRLQKKTYEDLKNHTKKNNEKTAG